MSNAQQKFAAVLPGQRFGLIQGSRQPNAPTQAPRQSLAAVPSVMRRYRGLTLVSGAQKACNTAEKVQSFDQARRIVAQVEWEIEQQAARERSKNLRRWQPLTMAAAGVAMPARAVASMPGMARLRHFFGL
jgi:hypothetical protein